MIGLPAGKKGPDLTGVEFGDGYRVERKLPTLHKSRYSVKHLPCGTVREMLSSAIGRVRSGKEKIRCRTCS